MNQKQRRPLFLLALFKPRRLNRPPLHLHPLGTLKPKHLTLMQMLLIPLQLRLAESRELLNAEGSIRVIHNTVYEEEVVGGR